MDVECDAALDVNSLIDFFTNIDKDNVELKHAIAIKDGCRFLLVKESQEYELNPNAVLEFVAKETGKSWRKTNVSSLVQEPVDGWSASSVKIGTRKKKKVCKKCTNIRVITLQKNLFS